MLSGRSGFLGIGLMLEPKLRQTRAAQSLQSDGASGPEVGFWEAVSIDIIGG